MHLEGKVAVISGVSKGIGFELCKQLVQKGCTVFGLGRNPMPIQIQNCYFIPTDIRQQQDVQRAFQHIFSKTQHIDILVNNAGLGYFGLMEEMPIEQWHDMFNTNVNGIFYCCREVIPSMKKNQYGHIINISSIAGLEGMPQVAGYCGTKWAVRGISESLFRELRDDRIKVTCVYPGSTKTDFFRNSPSIKAHDYMLMPEDVALGIIQALEMPDNFHTVNWEIRPLQPKGPKK